MDMRSGKLNLYNLNSEIQNKKLQINNNKVLMSYIHKQKTLNSGFILKLLKILEDQEFQEFIQWNENNDGFKILDVPQFTINVLPKFFNHQNYSSFIRQLNMYGFSKVKTQECQNAFHNPQFRRGERIELKRTDKKIVFMESDLQNNDRITLKRGKERYDSQKGLEQIKQRQTSLEEKFQTAISNNFKVFKTNTRVLQNLRKKNKNQQQFLSGLFKIFGTDRKEPRISTASTSRTFSAQQELKEKHESTLNDSNDFCKSKTYVALDEFQQMDELLRQM